MAGGDLLIEPLTQREREILLLLAQGLSDREVAQKLALAQGTVKRHNQQLYGKLGVHSRTEAVTRAREMGLLDDDGTTLVRGTVTFLFTDIEGSTKLWEQHPDEMEMALARHDKLLRHCVEQNHGVVVKTTGDGCHAVFDRAWDGVAAALAAQRALPRECQAPVIGRLLVRMGLHTGTAEYREGDYYGPEVNRAARLMAAGHGEQILVSASTRALVQGRLPEGLSLRDLGKHRLKDLERAERIYQLVAVDLPVDFPPLVSLDSHPDKLPAQLTSFVGREREIDIVSTLLAANRLLTLSGPPGTGKTRLAIHVARQNLDRFRDGVFFVDLAPISDTQLLISTIAQVLNLQETSGQTLINILIHHLSDKELLLLLDNFEQIIEAAPQLCDLLSACPGLKIMVTSREPLRVYGEQEYPVPPLALPDPARANPVQVLSKYEAVELFCQRARAVKPDFSLTGQNATAVSEICVRLDGLPLAIELAAARSKLLLPESMRALLRNHLLTLTGGARDLPARMQTLRAAIDWSYNLLDADEKRLLGRLSVFQGGRTIEAAEAICESGLPGTVLGGIESLHNKNLLFSKEGAATETRFYMLETIHEYARERFTQAGEADDIRTRHAMYFAALAERAEAELHGIRQAYWYARLADELDNFRIALNWTLEGLDVELGARLLVALRDYWYFKGLLSESAAWLERALENAEALSPVIRAKTLNASSYITYARGDSANAARLARHALSLGRDISNTEICAWAHLFISAALMECDGKIREVLTHAEEGLRMFQELDHKGGIMLGLNTLGELARLDGDYARAGQFYGECLALSIELGNKEREAVSLTNLTYVAYHQGDYDQAVDWGKKALSLTDSLRAEHAIAVILGIIAGPIGKGRPRLAARLLAASKTQMEAIGASLKPQDKLEIDRYKDAIRHQLGDAEFNKAWSEGRTLMMEQALALVAGES